MFVVVGGVGVGGVIVGVGGSSGGVIGGVVSGATRVLVKIDRVGKTVCSVGALVRIDHQSVNGASKMVCQIIVIVNICVNISWMGVVVGALGSAGAGELCVLICICVCMVWRVSFATIVGVANDVGHSRS